MTEKPPAIPLCKQFITKKDMLYLEKEEWEVIELALSKAYEQGLNSKIDVCPSDCVIASALNGKIAQLERDAIQQKVNYRKALEDAKQQGKLDLHPKIEAIEAIIEKTHDIGQVAVELYRLKSQLSKSEKKEVD
jgi:hypothetical protein